MFTYCQLVRLVLVLLIVFAFRAPQRCATPRPRPTRRRSPWPVCLREAQLVICIYIIPTLD